MSDSNNNSVSSSEYTADYYLTCCGGYEEFAISNGINLPIRLKTTLDYAALKKGDRVLDIGCGRGELLLHSALAGASAYGIDYSVNAVKIAAQSLHEIAAQDILPSIHMAQANAMDLPFKDESLDRVLMVDVVEHLYPHELHQSLLEVRRVLAPDGQLIIHTAPSLWYYHYGYPVYRFFQALRGKRLPANPRERWAYNHVHVNEQDPLKLRAALRAAGFEAKIFLEPAQTFAFEKNRLVRMGMVFVTRVYPFRWIFCDDLFAIAQKGGK
jgi:ubiquinone/menaquinone biosynthesis C-methylase UbiE